MSKVDFNNSYHNLSIILHRKMFKKGKKSYNRDNLFSIKTFVKQYDHLSNYFISLLISPSPNRQFSSIIILYHIPCGTFMYRPCSLVLWPLGRGLWRCVMAFTTSSRLFSCTLVTASCHWATERWMPDCKDDPRSRSILPIRVTTCRSKHPQSSPMFC